MHREDEEDRSLRKFARAQADRAMKHETNRDGARPDGAQSRFPLSYSQQPMGARQEYFEQRCLISHPRLHEALDATIQAICPPGAGASTRRPGTMVLVIGPSRVGKTTLIRLLEERLRVISKEQMARDPSFMPFASVLAAGPEAGHFDWREYYRAVLRSLAGSIRRWQNCTDTSQRTARSDGNGPDRA